MRALARLGRIPNGCEKWNEFRSVFFEVAARANRQGDSPAIVPASGSVLYYAEDMLGSSRVLVQSNGTLCYDADFTPFGAEKAYTSSCAQNYKFEGKERDAESQNDDFGARKYTWRFGRWLSSDWSALPVAVPYANLTNPQTLNLYAMVADDPESFADLDGHDDDAIKKQKKQKGQNKKASWWASLTGTVAAGMARISPAAARKLWEAANPGQKVPFDEIRGRFYDMAHIKPIADGGASATADNLKPQEHGEHMEEHMANGDFARWGARAKDAVVDAARAASKEIESDARSSANEVVQDVKEAVTEVIHNPTEAVRDAATAVVEAEESGELPRP